ncbi:glycosyltransferase [Providencia manganoxydans]|uniref:glycosyltransferase n=1 Tax=Providencia manganoxydans TaxID=2923283 RepID=UPI00296B8F14|nr:lipopolysaccharide 1,2-glucosyltransferase [Providencia stuartii]
MLTHEIIKSLVKINDDITSDKEYFHIAYGVDDKFLYGVGTSIASIILNNKETHFHFHILVDSITKQSLFDELVANTQHKITIYLIDNKEFKRLPLPSKAWSHAIYFRLVIIDYLSQTIDKLLYLDADIICKGDLSYLKTLEFNEDTYLYAVKDKFRSEKKSLPMDMHKYFNSGFLYMSVQRMVRDDIPNRVIELVKNNEFTHPDQDALNILLNDKLINISENFNFMFSLDWYITSKREISNISDDVIFIHFVGLTKPFHEWAKFYKEYQFFEAARQESPWKNIPLLKADSYKQLSRKKSHLRRNWKILPFLTATAEYLIKKMSH